MKLRFKNAQATNTRMMGVVGLLAYWEDERQNQVVHVYHLDYESYGIDGFHQLINPEEHELNKVVKGVTGGLGGEWVSIDFREYKFLVKSSYVIDPFCTDALVDFEYFERQFEAFFVDLNLDEENKLYEKLCPQLKSPIHAMHYFMMRYIGSDGPVYSYFWSKGSEDDSFSLVESPQTLIKNSAEKMRETENEVTYHCEALVDFECQYKILVLEVTLDKKTYKVKKAKLKETLTITGTEAAFNLSLPEYMSVFAIQDVFFKRKFAYAHPEMMRQDYPGGELFIAYHPHNGHVADNPYRLSADIDIMYFFSRDGQLIVCALDEKALKKVNDEFLLNSEYENSLLKICDLKADDPLLLTFIHSRYNNIFDFLAHQ